MRFKKCAFFVLLVVVLFAVTSVAFAAAPGSKAPTEANEPFKEAGIESLLYLQDWGSDINYVGDGYLNITGFTQAYQTVDYIMVRLYIQRWDGSNWVDMASWPFERYSNSYVAGAKGLQVTKGYYYRTKATHGLTENGYNESASSYSGYIYAN
ncbi:MAG: DUF6147 family protein [Desulfotomaculaceae bacterium]|nr:DUF6147 family protein [Desulfotomaculaceae bacterium]